MSIKKMSQPNELKDMDDSKPLEPQLHPVSKHGKLLFEDKARKVKILVPYERPLDLSLVYPDKDWIDFYLRKLFNKKNK